MTIQRTPGLLTSVCDWRARCRGQTCAHRGSRAPFQCAVDHDIDPASCLEKALSDAEEPLPTALQRKRPARSSEHLVKSANVALQMMASAPHRCGHRSASSGHDGSSQKGILLFQGGAVPMGASQHESGAWGLYGTGSSSLIRCALVGFSLPPKEAPCSVSSLKWTKSSLNAEGVSQRRILLPKMSEDTPG